jgi:hypothetical protein
MQANVVHALVLHYLVHRNRTSSHFSSPTIMQRALTLFGRARHDLSATPAPATECWTSTSSLWQAVLEHAWRHPCSCGQPGTPLLA